MNFIGPSFDDPRPRTNSQRVVGAGFLVAALAMTYIVLSAVAEVATAEVTIPLGEAVSPGAVLVVVLLWIGVAGSKLIHW